MVEINELPITGKIKDKFISYLSKNPLHQIHLGDFSKWEGGGVCAVCGHQLKWSFRGLDNIDIGNCCGSNILALQRCKGNLDELNFKRQLVLAKKTILKRQREWESRQKAIAFEIQYNLEYQFCKKVTDLVYADESFSEFVGYSKDSDRNYLYVSGKRGQLLSKIRQCESWLTYMNQGIVNEYYLSKIHDIMKQQPEQLIEEAKVKIKHYDEIIKKDNQKIKIDREYSDKVNKLRKINLGKFDIDFVKSLRQFYDEREYFTPKQKEAIEKLSHRYRNQINANT